MYYSNNSIYINSTGKVLFDLNNFDIYEMDQESLGAFDRLYNSDNPGAYALECGNTGVMEIYENLFQNRANAEIPAEKIFHVKLHTSNTCNLSCKYCYANHGNYNKEDKIMTGEKARQISRALKVAFPGISHITLFGGEPLLGLDAIEEICLEFGRSVGYTMVTNLTLLSDRAIELINQYGINVTVSIDGPKEVNDFCRVFENGEGTFDIISKNIRKLQTLTSSNLSIEGTYTLHSSKFYSFDEIIRYLHDTFDIKNIFMAYVSTEDPSLRIVESQGCDEEAMRNAIHNFFEDILSKKLYAILDIRLRPLQLFLTKLFEHYFCYASINSFSVDVDGNMWPCHLYMNNSDFFMGNILESRENISQDKSFTKVTDYMKSINKHSLSDCSQCIARYWCHLCLGMNVMNGKGLTDFSTENCEYYRKLTELVLEELSYYVENGRFYDIYNSYCSLVKPDMLID